MPYAVKEIFYTLQGEGVHAGRAAVFCRFAGCNLWSGREADRAEAVCQFCDTDFIGTDGDGGGKFADAELLAEAIAAKWPQSDSENRFVVCTGGEPLLQLDAALIQALHKLGFQIAIETNGTLPVPEGVDWVCVSPKAGAPLVVTKGNELKVVYPQETDPLVYTELEFANFFIQPKDGPDAKNSLQAAIQFCGDNPRWRLSLQTHKLIGIR
ncbi:7-carboxy-7-deazaguanine synthase [Granulicella paludicola]|jgi:7-carboxy-7-deazaguanine synthase (Cx14CxxC type)|uniref:7-carboxy-7-deazaguanine synthase n=1 Tax=Granulicella paludicola TaxID=474951 RepID=UPI0021DFC349|nr:7-carboxy-7-deazaguanine synthase [Granulicella paludicola]